ncbi:LamG domain-containing protein, partial [Patescibacteria group bacterium]
DEITQLYNQTKGNVANKTVESSGLESGLVGHWTFDGPDMLSNVADTSGQGNNGSLVGQTSTTTVEGKVGQALEFDGSDDYVDVGQDNFNSYDRGAITAWVKFDNFNSEQIVFTLDPDHSYRGFSVLVDQDSAISPGADRRLTVYSRGGSNNYKVYGDTVFDPGVWYHIAVISTGTEYTFYVNGVSETLAGSLNDGYWFADMNSTPWMYWIGYFNSAAFVSNTDGVLDDLRVYDRALSADEIERLYQLGR